VASSFRHHPFYCEENVWHLCGDPGVPGCDKRVVFISNEARRVAMWGQSAANAPGEPVVWDYHVVLLSRTVTWQVWDLDSTLALGLPFDDWARGSFELAVTPVAFHPRFRCIDAQVFRDTFGSDRRHMRRPDGTDVSPAPPWPCIGREHNLDRFADMRDASGPGELHDFEGLRRRFGSS
jgi:protein N-terminal glutamine amidohydrolase